MLISTLFFGTSKLGLEYSQFIASLMVMGLGLGLNFFCWLTVFVFRKNLLQDQRMLESGGREIAPITHISQHFFVSGKPSQMSCDTMSPPPAYQDLDLENWDTEASYIYLMKF